jgi:hypothetical protein
MDGEEERGNFRYYLFGNTATCPQSHGSTLKCEKVTIMHEKYIVFKKSVLYVAIRNLASLIYSFGGSESKTMSNALVRLTHQGSDPDLHLNGSIAL